jgi:hypothetical protein
MTILGLRRTAWVMLALALVAAFLFATPRRVLLFYASSLIAITWLFFHADYINQNWQTWQSYLPASSSFQRQAFQIGTFTDRVNSYKNTLEDKEVHTLFGLPKDHPRRRGSETVSHDAVGDVLVSYGFFGLFLVTVCAVGTIFIVHRIQFSLRDRDLQNVVRLLMGILVAHIFTSVVFQSHINIFPINILFWMTFGLLITFFRRVSEKGQDGLDAFLNFERWQREEKHRLAQQGRPVVAGVGHF